MKAKLAQPFDLAELLALPIPEIDLAELTIDDKPVVVPDGYFTLFTHTHYDAAGHAKCIGCGKRLTCWLLGTFTWGLANGEGYCSNCGYPSRAIHRFKYADGTDACVQLLLQYHPSTLVVRMIEGG